MRVVCTVSLKRFSKTSALVATYAKRILQVNTLHLFEKENQSKVERGVMNMYPRGPFNFIIANCSNFVIKLATHQHNAKTSPSSSKIIPIKSDENSPCPL